MGLLQKLKSALGLNGSRSPGGGKTAPEDVDVTVEREPSSETEDAVKGTDTADDPSTALSADEADGTTADEATAETDATEGESEAETADEPETESEPESEAETEDAPGSGVPVTEINGIGPAYGQRLNDAGVDDVADLAGADAEELGEATGLSPNRIAGWIDQAESF